MGLKKYFKELKWENSRTVFEVRTNMFSVVTVIETGTETAFFFAKPNRTETAVLCLCIDGSVLKWSSSGVLNVNSKLQSSRPLVSPVGVIVGIKGEIAGGGGHAPRVCA